jgi:Spy/CpxP family protein refolding chaperone
MNQSSAEAKTRRSTGGILIGLLALAALSPLAGAAHARPSHREGGLEEIERAIESMTLDAGSREVALGILDDARRQRRAFEPELRQARDQLRELLAVDPPDEGAVFAQAEVIAALDLAASVRQLQDLLSLRALLTADQWRAVQPQRPSRRGRGDLGAMR